MSEQAAAATAAGDVGLAGTAASAEKSDGQLLLERMLAQCNRFNSIRRRLDEIQTSILPVPGSVTLQPATGDKPAPEKSFFGALRMLLDGNDQVADELEFTVDRLGKLF